MVGYLAELHFKQKYHNHCDRVHTFISAVGEM